MIRVTRWKHPTNKLHLYGFLQGFGELADSLVTLLSLGFFMSNFEMEVCRLRARAYFKDLKHMQNIKDTNR